LLEAAGEEGGVVISVSLETVEKSVIASEDAVESAGEERRAPSK
jgi:hypothetical protein